MTNRDILQIVIDNFEEKTGIKAHYEKQRGNGSWLFLETQDNGGEGFYIGVDGFVDACNTINHILMGYTIAKKGGATL